MSKVMTKPWVVTLGILSTLPLIGFIFAIAWLPNYAAKLQATGQGFAPIFVFGKTYIIVGWLITIGAIVIALRSPQVQLSKRVMWFISLLVFNIFALPVFWYHHIWRPYHVKT